jgi:hypothetical protein
MPEGRSASRIPKSQVTPIPESTSLDYYQCCDCKADEDADDQSNDNSGQEGLSGHAPPLGSFIREAGPAELPIPSS